MLTLIFAYRCHFTINECAKTFYNLFLQPAYVTYKLTVLFRVNDHRHIDIFKINEITSCFYFYIKIFNDAFFIANFTQIVS